jgi:hypothetical protein
MAALVNVTTDPRLDVLQEEAHAHNVELSIYRIARVEEIVAATDMPNTGHHYLLIDTTLT